MIFNSFLIALALSSPPGTPNLQPKWEALTNPATGSPEPVFVRIRLEELEPDRTVKFADLPLDRYAEANRWSLAVKHGKATIAVQPTEARLIGHQKMLVLMLPKGTLSKGDTATVTVKTEKSPGVPVSYTNDVADKVPALPIFLSFTPTPAIQNKQKLIDGKTTSVGEMKLSYKQYLEEGQPLYLKSDSVISSNDLDSASSLDFHIGTGSKLKTQYLIPVFAEVGTTGNQKWSNAEALATAGVGPFVLPAHLQLRVRKVVTDGDDPNKPNISYLSSGVPTLTFGLQGADWFKQDPLVTAKHPDKDSLRLTGELALTPLYLFQYWGRDTAFLSADFTGWYFPTEHATGGANVRRLEGLADMSLNFPFNSSSCLSLHWLTGAQASNNFVRTSSFGFEISVVK